MPAVRASRCLVACVERLEERGQVTQDALQLDSDSMHQTIAARAVPLEAVLQSDRALPLDDQAEGLRLWALWRMPQMWRQQQDRPFPQLDPVTLAPVHDVEIGVPLELPEERLEGSVTKTAKSFMSTRKAVISTQSASVAPSLLRMSRMFSMTARVWVRMSSMVVPSASTSTPAKLLSGRRELVPETKRESPAHRMCGNRPRGRALCKRTPMVSESVSARCGQYRPTG